MSTKKLLESLALNEKINHANDDINRVLANPNAGRNREKIKDMGYEPQTTSDGKVFGIRNPKTKRWLDPSQYSREEKKKVDFKGKLDSERKNNQGRFYPEYVPKGLKTGAGRGYAQADRDEMEAQNGISKNVKDYKKAVKDKKDAEHSVKYADDSMKYYEDKVTQAQKDLDFHKEYRDNRQKDAERAEEKRQALMAKVREKHQKTTESDEYVNSLSIPKLLEEIYQGYTEIFESNDFWEDLSNMFDFDEGKLKKWLQNLADEAGTGE